MKPSLCIYHGNCADGFASAWVVRKYFAESELMRVEFYAGVYQNPPPDVKDRDVILVDFSYKRDVIVQMLEEVESLTIIDHHASAIKDLDSLIHPRLTTSFAYENEHSGAMMTWLYFFGQEQPPQLLHHIEDRDLWKFALPRTREIQANIFSFPYDFAIWDKMMAMDADELEVFSFAGEAIERKHFKDIHELIKVTHRFMIIGEYRMPVANLSYTMSSDAGHIMAKNSIDGVAACYWDTADGRVFSLRSLDTGPDVSEIAKLYGGGGHKHAAGFKVSYDKAKEFEVA